MHDGITHESAIENVVRSLFCLGTDLGNQVRNGSPHRFAHLLLGTRVHHDVGHATHQVFTKANLWIHPPGRCQRLAAREVHQVGRNRGRSDVEGHSQSRVVITRPYRHNLTLPEHSDRHPPLPGPERVLQRRQHMQVALKIRETPFKFQFFKQPPQIRDRLVHARFRDLNHMQADQGIDRKIVHLGPLADHLPVYLAFRRHINDSVVQKACRTPQTSAFGKTISLIVGDLVFA